MYSMQNTFSVPPPEPPPMPQAPQPIIPQENSGLVKNTKKLNIKKHAPLIILTVILFSLIGGWFYFFFLKRNSKNVQPAPQQIVSFTPVPQITQPVNSNPENQVNTKTQNEVADDRRRVTLQNIIQPALELYKAENGSYPASLETLVPNFLSKIPQDPVTQETYLYNLSADKTQYTLSATLDDGTVFSVSSP